MIEPFRIAADQAPLDDLARWPDAALEEPARLVEDIRAFFRPLR